MRFARSLTALAAIVVAILVSPSYGLAQGTGHGNPEIAFFSKRFSKGAWIGTDLVVIDANGANRTVIGSVPELHTYRLSWSPDRDPITPGYQGTIVYSTANRLYTEDINIPGDGTFSWISRQQIPITIPDGNTSMSAYYPVWSPVGDTIALYGFTNNGSVTTLGGVWTLPPAGGPPTWVAHGEYPGWDPTGRYLTYKYNFDLFALQISPTLASSPVTLVTNIAQPSSSTATWPSWSSNGIAFAGVMPAKNGYQAALFVMNPNTTPTPVDLSQLKPVPGAVANAWWAPDSQHLISTSSKGIVQIDPVTGVQTVVYADSNAIQPDSRR